MPQHRIEMGLDIGMRFDPRPRWERERRRGRRPEPFAPFDAAIPEEDRGDEPDAEDRDDDEG